MNLRELKSHVCEQNRRLLEYGLVILTEGNVSQISADRKYMVIKPSGVEYADLTPEQMAVVDMQGRVLEGVLRPSVDTPTHLEIYRRYPDISGISHTHSPFATIFAQMQKPIPPHGTTHADAFPDSIPVTRHLTDEEIKGDLEKQTAAAICEILDQGNHRCVLVARHGPFTFGKDAGDAVQHAAIAEKVAMMAILGQYDEPMRAALLRRHHDRKHGENNYYGQPDA